MARVGSWVLFLVIWPHISQINSQVISTNPLCPAQLLCPLCPAQLLCPYSLQNFHHFLPASSVTAGCGEKTVVSGDIWKRRQTEFHVDNIFTHNKAETSPKGFWLAPDRTQGSFIINLGCQHTFQSVNLVNTHNQKWRDRSTKEFRLSVSQSEEGPWLNVLQHTLRDSRKQKDPLPLQRIALPSPAEGQFLKFDLLQWYGKGGGLQYFDIVGEQIETCIGQQCDDAGLPNSEFPGLDTETVCSKQSCDPQIMKLYKNSSVIENDNLLKIDEINKANQLKGFSWVAGSTTFSSVSFSEVQAFRMGEIPPSRTERKQTPERVRLRRQFLTSLETNRTEIANSSSPESAVEVFTTDANNQGECSSCSVFAVTAALETCVAKVVPNPAFRFAPPRGLSSQNMLDCAFGNPGLFGCDGGQSFRYLDWLKDGTLDTNRQYPYLDSGIKFEGVRNDYRRCYQSGARASAVMEKSHSSWDDHTERDLENILLDGHAIITTMEVQEDLMFYKSGVYQSESCQDWKLGVGRDAQWEEESGLKPLRHAVVIVGFGEEQGQKYWKVKNSWGENWGSSGFFKIIRNGSAHCGLGAYFSVALCTECGSQDDCKPRSQGSVKPAQRPPPSLPEEGIAAGFTSHLATPLGGVGFSTCPGCDNLSECPKLVPCRIKTSNGKDKCCRVFGGRGNRLYCPASC